MTIQEKTCCVKQHTTIDMIWKLPDLICGIGAVGRNYNLTHDNLRIYFTDKECSMEEAMIAFDELVFTGNIKTKVSLVGYSEFTIMGLELDRFTIGGHDLETEISSHYGEYMHLIIEI